MTAMPQLVSLFNAVGGGAAALVAIDDYPARLGHAGASTVSTAIFVVLGAVIGSVTFSGSLIASGKLQGVVPGRPIMFPGSRLVTVLAALVAVGRPRRCSSLPRATSGDRRADHAEIADRDPRRRSSSPR